MLTHLNVRVPWRRKRDGTVCRAPGQNSFCLDLDIIRENRDDAADRRPGRIRMPAHSTLVVPFRWTLRQNQELIDSRLP